MAVGAFIAGSIVGKMVLDSKQWKTDTKKVTGDKSMGAWAQNNSAKLRGIGMAMTAAGAAILAGLKVASTAFITTGDLLDKMSLRTGISATALSELGHAANIAGADINVVEKGVKKMAKSLTDADLGLTTYLRSFQRLGLSVSELMAMSPDEQFETIGIAIAGLGTETEKAATAQEIFGRAGTQLLPLFKQGEDGIKKLREEAHRLGIVMDQEAAAKAAEWADAQTRLSASVKGLGLTIGQTLAPAVTGLIDFVTNIVAKFSEWGRSSPTLTRLLVGLGTALGGLLAIGGPILIMLPQLVRGFGLLKGAIGGIATKLGPIAAVGAAAFVGWNIGRLIGEFTGLDKVIVKTFDNLIAKAGLWQGTAELSARSTELQARKADMLAEASRIAGKEITSIVTANQILNGTIQVVNGELLRQGEETAAVTEKQKKWTAYLKDNSIPSAEEYATQLADLKDKKKILKTALDEGVITLATYKAEVGKVDGEIKKLTGSTDKVAEAQKTWLDYLAELGGKTVKEKADRVTELEGYVDDLNEAYKQGTIDITAYRLALDAAEKEIDALSTTIVDTALPASRSMGDVLGAAVDDMETDMGRFPEIVKTNAEAGASWWSKATDGIKTNWITMWSDILKAKSFDDIVGAAKAMANAVVSQVRDMAAQALAKWTLGFVQKFVTGAAEAGSTVVGGFKDVASGAMNLAKGFSPTGMLASAIGTAIGGFLGSLFKKGPSANDTRLIKDHTWAINQNLLNLHNALMAQLDAIKLTGWSIYELMKAVPSGGGQAAGGKSPTENLLHSIVINTNAMVKLLRKKKGAASGAVFTESDMAFVHGSTASPEYVLPEPLLLKALSAAAAGGGGGSLDQQNNFNFNVQSGREQDYIRRVVIPEVINALDANFMKARFQTALGVK